MQWKTLSVDALRPAAYNPRKKLKPGDKEYEKIKNSIQEFGYVEPIIVNYDMTVIGGHQRLTVLKDLGYTEVQCVEVHIEDENKVKALNVALNKITGSWNEQLLADLIVDLQTANFNTDFTGFEAPEIEQLFSKVHNKEIKEDSFDVEAELKKPTIAKLGDVWMLGRHRVICGDSTLPETYTTLMDGKRANLVLTDPPYGVSFKSSTGLTIKNDSIKDEEFYEFLLNCFTNMANSLEPGGVSYVFHADTVGHIFRKAFIDSGFHLQGVCIWAKNALVPGYSDYQWRHEPILYGYLPNGKHAWYSDRSQTTVWNFDKQTQNNHHPTSKPLDLLCYPIGNSCRENALVLDTFGGSGSTLMACEQMNRICYMMELDEKYASVILRRYVDNTGDADNVYVIRDGVKFTYAELAKEVETKK
jgi:site-specific DNA-methyltransferase (adenine-specific)